MYWRPADHWANSHAVCPFYGGAASNEGVATVPSGERLGGPACQHSHEG